MTIHGVRLSDNFSPAEVRPKNWREGLLLLEPNGDAPLFALTAGMRSESTDDAEFNWFEKEMQAQRFASSTNLDATAGSDTLTTAAGAAYAAGVRVNHILRVEGTGELLLVTTAQTSGGTTLTVTRGWGATTVTAHNFGGAGLNPNLQVVGTANEENSDSPTSVQFDPVRRTNFTQIFRDTLEASRTAMNTHLRTGDAVREAKRETLQIHSANIERAFLFGRGNETSQTINGRPARTTYGLYHYLTDNYSANVITAPATVTFAVIEDWLELIFRFGSSEKLALIGNRAMLVISRAVRLATNTQITIGVAEKEYGMNVRRLVSPFGTLVLKTHKLMNQITSGIQTSEYLATDSWAFVLDMKNFKYRYLKNSDTQYQPKLQGNGIDGMKSGYLTECGLEIHHPKTHAIIRGIGTAGAG